MSATKITSFEGAFVAWLVRARAIAERLGGAPAWTPRWAVGAWFIPVANLVLPYVVVRDVQRASSVSPGRAVAGAAPVGRW